MLLRNHKKCSAVLAFVASIVPRRSKSESPEHQQGSLRLEAAAAKAPMEMTFFQL